MAMTYQIASKHNPLGADAPRELVRYSYKAMRWIMGSDVRVEGAEHLPTTPALLACNSTHRFDPLTFRVALLDLGHDAATVSKGKNWHDPATAWFAAVLGALPLVSRGYLITMDFMSVVGRRPEPAEYRALRDHLDGGDSLPAGAPFDQLLRADRAVLGFQLNLGQRSYRAAMLDAYASYQAVFLRQAGEVVRSGRHIHMYPQGTVSSRLSEGRIGAVQVAAALRIPVVPVGICGAATAFRSASNPLPRRGVVTVKLGEPYHLPEGALPPDFRAFDPVHEEANRSVLQRLTGDLMERINALVEPGASWSVDRASDGKQGTHRFA